MIRRLLVANRGEIARRIIRACRELEIETVAVFSDADANAPHVGEADHAVRIGAAPPRDSYLNITITQPRDRPMTTGASGYVSAESAR